MIQPYWQSKEVCNSPALAPDFGAGRVAQCMTAAGYICGGPLAWQSPQCKCSVGSPAGPGRALLNNPLTSAPVAGACMPVLALCFKQSWQVSRNNNTQPPGTCCAACLLHLHLPACASMCTLFLAWSLTKNLLHLPAVATTATPVKATPSPVAPTPSPTVKATAPPATLAPVATTAVPTTTTAPVTTAAVTTTNAPTTPAADSRLTALVAVLEVSGEGILPIDSAKQVCTAVPVSYLLHPTFAFFSKMRHRLSSQANTEVRLSGASSCQFVLSCAGQAPACFGRPDDNCDKP